MSNAYVVLGADGLKHIVDEADILGVLPSRPNWLSMLTSRPSRPAKAAPSSSGDTTSTEKNTLANIQHRLQILSAKLGLYQQRGDVSNEAAADLQEGITELEHFVATRQSRI